jgi:hypothetical protein
MRRKLRWVVVERQRRLRLANRSPPLPHTNVVLTGRIDLLRFVEPVFARAEVALRARGQALFAKGRLLVLGAGILIMSVLLARGFGRFHGGL